MSDYEREVAFIQMIDQQVREMGAPLWIAEQAIATVPGGYVFD